MSDSLYNALDEMGELGVADEEVQRLKAAGAKEEDYMRDVDSVFSVLHLDTATDGQRAHGANLHYMDDSLFDLLEHEKLIKKH